VHLFILCAPKLQVFLHSNTLPFVMLLGLCCMHPPLFATDGIAPFKAGGICLLEGFVVEI
jgi:hypothetical protein